MKTLGLLLTLLCVRLPAGAQEIDLHEGALIESAEVQGLALDKLSADLRRDIQALSDQRLSRERVNALAARIEDEHPDVVAAVRDVLRTDGRVRVIFLVAPIGDDSGLATNINARYVVERVEIAGIEEGRVSRRLRDELQRLVGDRLDPKNAERLSNELEAELPDYDVTRRISRGSETGKILVVFHFEKSERRYWIPYEQGRTKIVYHANQKWTAVFDLGTNIGDNTFAFGFTPRDNDDLIEKYSGVWLRLENRKAGTKRVGLSLEFAKYTPKWAEETLSALALSPGIPAAYGGRRSVQPAVTFAIDRRVRFRAGLDASKLDPLGSSGIAQHANAAVASLAYDQTWRPESGAKQRVAGAFEWREGAASFGSDLNYKRQLGQAHYFFEHHHRLLRADLFVGRLSGQAPLFERFSLGDSLTLRGWNKLELAPLGGDRMWHQSIEYSYRNFAYFLDAGSIWQKGSDARVRVSAGVGYHFENGFVTLAFPLNGDDVGATFMMGLRFMRNGLERR